MLLINRGFKVAAKGKRLIINKSLRTKEKLARQWKITLIIKKRDKIKGPWIKLIKEWKLKIKVKRRSNLKTAIIIVNLRGNDQKEFIINWVIGSN